MGLVWVLGGKYVFPILVNDITTGEVTQAKSSGVIVSPSLQRSEHHQTGVSLSILPPYLDSYQHAKPPTNSSSLPVTIVLLSSLLLNLSSSVSLSHQNLRLQNLSSSHVKTHCIHIPFLGQIPSASIIVLTPDTLDKLPSPTVSVCSVPSLNLIQFLLYPSCPLQSHRMEYDHLLMQCLFSSGSTWHFSFLLGNSVGFVTHFLLVPWFTPWVN